jgi:hypothetical protein
MECKQVVLTLTDEAPLKLLVADIVAFVYDGSEYGSFDFPGTKCDIECAHVGLPDVASVSVVSVPFPLGAIPEAIDVGSGSYVNDDNTREVVPEGQMEIPLIVHGSMGCGQMIIGAERVRAL